ncbi:uncharacterized protein BO95DRAFT_88378 [Aspergillus brunneoviolaceus CBS 621.78]|uniref:Uncharacterized protein n=1 Tax=Aspergillus brunneoviolaceus CBS 621.78 TaxID=1450534 RepID=A0ACD1GDD5_9EURO|nr:hypothetical protein BO95DRAFT_88378 [Aspergillus brunneoviolaceus CBS 621.78]RAH47289.1 hypothetical protein BO95DRAFT_88378 [Aspergillus brunneoviolaceus CBS 621.78]
MSLFGQQKRDSGVSHDRRFTAYPPAWVLPPEHGIKCHSCPFSSSSSRASKDLLGCSWLSIGTLCRGSSTDHQLYHINSTIFVFVHEESRNLREGTQYIAQALLRTASRYCIRTVSTAFKLVLHTASAQINTQVEKFVYVRTTCTANNKPDSYTSEK